VLSEAHGWNIPTRAEITALPQRFANWRLTRDWAQKSLAVWDGWEMHGGVSSVFNTTRREHVACALAQCDAALSLLTVSP